MVSVTIYYIILYYIIITIYNHIYGYNGYIYLYLFQSRRHTSMLDHCLQWLCSQTESY